MGEQEKLDCFQQMIDASDNIVFFGGAGMSTESGIPDFRSSDGLYQQKYPFPPETIISNAFYRNHPEEFYTFYRDHMLCLTATPNAGHLKLAELEKSGKLRAVITQNIDGLHQLAGSKTVLELHGSVHRNYCTHCGKPYDAQLIKDSACIPKCTCGGIIKPDVVLYGESLDPNTLRSAVIFITRADMLIIGGTSLAVYPAAGLIDHFRGHRLVMINRTQTGSDERADLVIQDNIGKVLDQVVTHQ